MTETAGDRGDEASGGKGVRREGQRGPAGANGGRAAVRGVGPPLLALRARASPPASHVLLPGAADTAVTSPGRLQQRKGQPPEGDRRPGGLAPGPALAEGIDRPLSRPEAVYQLTSLTVCHVVCSELN